jgi:hypothetical protein
MLPTTPHAECPKGAAKAQNTLKNIPHAMGAARDAGAHHVVDLPWLSTPFRGRILTALFRAKKLQFTKRKERNKEKRKRKRK